jgi:hypothetical protein
VRRGQTGSRAVTVDSGSKCRIGLWRDTDDVQAQSARRAEPTEIDPTHGAGGGLPFRPESVAVAVEDIVDVGAAAEDQPIAQITYSAVQRFLRGQLAVGLQNGCNLLRPKSRLGGGGGREGL